MSILGVDPGLEYFGWAVLRPKTGAVIALGVIETSRNPKLDVAIDRAVRTSQQSAELGELLEEHDVVSIAAEAISLGGPPAARVSMAMCLGLSWGSICALSRSIGAELFALPPKQWQHAVAPEAVVTKGKRQAIDYDVLYNELRKYVDGQCGEQLDAIPKTKRTHAIDAVGVGLFHVFHRERCARVQEVCA